MKKKKTSDEPKSDAMEKLVKLTKLIKKDRVAVEEKAPMSYRGVNKWRSYDPKFKPKAPKPENVVQVGSMDVDPALQQEYENWRKDKQAEQIDRRVRYHRSALAKARARAEQNESTPPVENSENSGSNDAPHV